MGSKRVRHSWAAKHTGFPSGHVRLWELDHKEGRTPKNWYLWTEVPEKTPESPLGSKEIKPVSLKRDQPWIFPRQSDAEAEAPVFWSSNVNRRFTGKVPGAGKDWGQKKKRASEDEMAGWHHWCNEHELGQTPQDGEGEEGLGAAVHGIAKSRTQLGKWTTACQESHAWFSSWQLYTVWLQCYLSL